MFDRISFERLLEVTASDLDVISNKLGLVYTNSVDDDAKLVLLAEAFTLIHDWSSYYNRFKDVQDSKLIELSNNNSYLLAENKMLNKKVAELEGAYNSQLGLVAELKAKLAYQNTLISTLKNNDTIINNKNVPDGLDLVALNNKLDALFKSYESTIKEAEHKAAMKTFNQRVASGEVKPAKRADVSDSYIIENYYCGVSAYKISQAVGLTPQAILYRIKILKKDGLILEDDALISKYTELIKNNNDAFAFNKIASDAGINPEVIKARILKIKNNNI